ncbi:tetratricopeptide repeat protein [Patescibacteria group bacterium]|nr:tetratricopeptide repeat protein [Patescibacteria group bacterium]
MKKLSSFVLLTLTALTPLLVLPIGEAFVANTKQFLVLLTALVLLAIAGIKMLIEKNLSITLSSFTTVLAVFGTAVTAAVFLTNSYPVDNLLGFGGVYLAMILIACLGKGLVDKKFSRNFLTIFGISASLFSLSSILQFMGYGPSWIYNALLKINLNHDLLFGLVESPMVATQILGVALVGLLASLISRSHLGLAITHKKNKKVTLLTWVMLAIITAGFGLNMYSVLPGQAFSPIMPSLAASWSVAVDMLRVPQTAFLGAGPNNYHLAYAQFKPAWINQTPLWNIQFTSGINLPLTLLVSTGILGLASWIWLVLRILKQIKYQAELKNSPLTWMLLALLALQLLLPPFISLLILFGLVLAAWLSLPEHKFDQLKLHTLTTHIAQGNYIAQGIGVILLIVFGYGTYSLGKAIIADYSIFAGNRAGQNNQITQMYQLQHKAVLLNPYLASYRRRYALTNLSIATALANKADLTEQERASILQLIQQAIREGQAAAELQPADVRNWQVLAQVYNNLAGVAEGADQWAVNSYVQAIQASPTNPDLRIALGSIFYGVGQYDQASQLFTQAIQLKPDHANAHYNLANTLKMQGKLSEAVVAYENVLSLIEPGSEDYKIVAEELATLREKLANTGGLPQDMIKSVK